MRIKLLQPYNGFPAGRELSLGSGVADLLFRRGIAELVEARPDPPNPTADPDQDGQDEGGEAGTKKAFTKPPSRRRNTGTPKG
jgi:hypothetical protein